MRGLSRAARRATRHKRNPAAVLNLTSLMDIFTILVLYLLVNTSDSQEAPSADVLELPDSIAEAKPDETLTVMVTSLEILIKDEKIASISTIVDDKSPEINSLKSVLEDYAKGIQPVAKSPDATPTRDITIMMDKSIPYTVLKRVMATCNVAGFGNVALAVISKPAG